MTFGSQSASGIDKSGITFWNLHGKSGMNHHRLMWCNRKWRIDTCVQIGTGSVGRTVGWQYCVFV